MIGDVLGSLLGLANEAMGDPIGSFVDAYDRAERTRKQEPAYKLAQRRVELLKRLDAWRIMLDRAIKYDLPSKHECQKQVDEIKEELNMLG